jgi:hypothetical protein
VQPDGNEAQTPITLSVEAAVVDEYALSSEAAPPPA